jgi:hypothetical protein
VGLYLTFTGDGTRTDYDLHRLQVAGKYCRDMPQHELFRAIKHIVPGVVATMGHQQLCQELAAWMSTAAPKES